jgi:hypothetical protein
MGLRVLEGLWGGRGGTEGVGWTYTAGGVVEVQADALRKSHFSDS